MKAQQREVEVTYPAVMAPKQTSLIQTWQAPLECRQTILPS